MNLIFDKMKVSSALNVFSRSVGVRLRYLVEYENYDKGLLTTAWFIEFSDRWFNLAASRNAVTALSRKNVNAYNKAIKHLEEAVAVFTDLKCGKQWKPWQAGVVLSTTTIIKVKVQAYSPDIHKSSADFTITFPGYGTHTYIRTLPHLPGENAAMQHTKATALYQSQHSFHVPPGTHCCWVDRGNVG